MAIYMQLMSHANGLQFHVYDSFEGLPETTEHDASPTANAKEGALAVSIEEFKAYFAENNVPLPSIHKGWFSEVIYPEKIAFAFLDGDLYSSILDSWQKVYPRLSPGGYCLRSRLRFTQFARRKKSMR